MYCQLILCQGFAVGISCGMIFGPVLTVIGHWFKRKRALAFGVASFGATIGGVLFPIAARKLPRPLLRPSLLQETRVRSVCHRSDHYFPWSLHECDSCWYSSRATLILYFAVVGSANVHRRECCESRNRSRTLLLSGRNHQCRRGTWASLRRIPRRQAR